MCLSSNSQNNEMFFKKAKNTILKEKNNFKKNGNQESTDNKQDSYQEKSTVNDKGKAPMSSNVQSSNLSSFPINVSDSDSDQDPEEPTNFTLLAASHYLEWLTEKEIRDKEKQKQKKEKNQTEQVNFETQVEQEYSINPEFNMGSQDFVAWNETLLSFSESPNSFLTLTEYYYLQQNFKYKENLFNFSINNRYYRIVRLTSGTEPSFSILYKRLMRSPKGMEERYTLVREGLEKEEILQALDTKKANNLKNQEEAGTSYGHQQEEAGTSYGHQQEEAGTSYGHQQEEPGTSFSHQQGNETVSTSFVLEQEKEEELKKEIEKDIDEKKNEEYEYFAETHKFVQGVNPTPSSPSIPSNSGLPFFNVSSIIFALSVAAGTALSLYIYKNCKKKKK